MTKLEWENRDNGVTDDAYAFDGSGNEWHVAFEGISSKGATLDEGLEFGDSVAVYCNGEFVTSLPVWLPEEGGSYCASVAASIADAKAVAESRSEREALKSRTDEPAGDARKVEWFSMADEVTGISTFGGCTSDGYAFHGTAAVAPHECGIVTPDHPDGSAVVKLTVCNPVGVAVYDFDHACYCVPAGDDDMDAVNEIIMSLDLRFVKGE